MRTLRSHLIGLVLLAMIPSIAISTVTALQAISAFSNLYEEGLQDTAQALALALDREIETLSTALTVMALSPELDEGGDLVTFQRRAREVALALDTSISLFRPDETLAISTTSSLADGVHLAIAPEQFREAVETGKPGLTNILSGQRPGAGATAIYQPVMRHGRAVGVLAVAFTSTQTLSLLSGETRRRSYAAAVADGEGAIISRRDQTRASTWGMEPDWMREGSRGKQSGRVRGVDRSGTAMFGAFARPVHAPQWSVFICEPQGFYDTTWRPPLAARLAASMAALILAVTAAAWLGRGLSRPLTALAEHAQASAYGTDPPRAGVPRSSVAEFEALRTSLERADMVLRRRGAAERMALQEARTGHELLASVVNGTADLIYVKDVDLCFVLANRAALAMGGEAREEWQVLGRRSIDLIPFDPATAEETLDREVISTGELRFINVEWADAAETDPVASIGPAGAAGRRIFALTKTPWRDADGAICGVVTVARDVTRQRAAESRLTAVQGELLRASRLSAMGAMASGLAHELNQPLAAATNFLNAAARLLDRATTGDVRVHVGPVIETARTAVVQAAQQTLRAGGIVRRLRNFIGRGEAELRVEDMADVIREACDVARADGAGRSSQLTVNVSDDAGLALADRTQMQQVLLNLIRNAGEALTDQADGRIVVAAGKVLRGGVQITVTDNGPGISELIAGKLFQPFVSTKTNGMGIGLAICGTIVEGHGGRLTAEASPGGGALFRIVLPALESQGEVHESVRDASKDESR